MATAVRMRLAQLEIPVPESADMVYRCKAILTAVNMRKPEIGRLGSASFTLESTGPVTMSAPMRRRRRRQRPIVPRPAEFWCHR